MLQNQLHEKELEVKVLNQMIVSANKMVQVKTTELNRVVTKMQFRNSMPTIREASDEFTVHILVTIRITIHVYYRQQIRTGCCLAKQTDLEEVYLRQVCERNL